MTFPDDLPWMIEYRMRHVVLTTLPRRAVQSIGSSGVTDANIVHPTIPVGCTGWRRVGEAAWRDLADIPEHWLPFLQRSRPSEMDPRAALEKTS